LRCYDSDLMDVTADTYGILEEKCLIEDPQSCGTPMAYVFFVLYTCIITFVILNLVIAVILDVFEDSSTNDEGDLVSRCIDRWGKYDPNYTMLLPVNDVFKFVSEVAGEHLTLVRPLPDLDQTAGSGGKVDIGKIPMWIANCCDMKLDARQHMHFIDVVKVVLRIVLSSNNPQVLSEIKESSAANPKLQRKLDALENQQKARQKYRVIMCQPDCSDLNVDVATIKLAGLLRIIRAKKLMRLLMDARAKGELKNTVQPVQLPPKAG